jgi:hypothetical protein
MPLKLKKIIHKTETVKNTEQELNKIMTESKSEADKQQRFVNLLTRLKLPIDSADAFSRRLSYPEMFKSVQEWIRNKRYDRRAQKMVWATFLAVLSAAIFAMSALVTLLKK